MDNVINDLLDALKQIAELDGDAENQKFKLTRFQASQIARRAIHDVKHKILCVNPKNE